MSATLFRVGIDCRLAGQRHAGIGRYIENLVREILFLEQKENPIDWVLFFNDAEQAEQVLGKIDSQPLHVTVVLTQDVRHYSLAEQWYLPKLFSEQNLDLLHVPHFNIPIAYQGILIVTIHDLLWHEYRGAEVTTLPKWKYWPKYLMYRCIVWWAVKRASKIITPSQTVATQVTKYFPDVSQKIIVTFEGVEKRFFTTDRALKLNARSSKNLLYVGSLYPHKNIKIALEALQLLPDYTLSIVSARTVFQDKIEKFAQELNVSQQVTFHGRLSDEKVKELLNESLALIQPSLSEGFGLTGLEAMAAGCPVIASDIPIFREVYKDHAVYFNPHSSKEFVQAVKTVANQDRSQYAKNASAFARQYSWSTMAAETTAVYRSLLSSRSI